MPLAAQDRRDPLAGRNQDIAPQKKFARDLWIYIDRMIIGCGVRKFKKQRPLNRQTGARSFFRKRVQIGHQPVALFDKTPADSLRLGTTDPGFLVAGPLLSVIPVDGLE